MAIGSNTSINVKKKRQASSKNGSKLSIGFPNNGPSIAQLVDISGRNSNKNI